MPIDGMPKMNRDEFDREEEADEISKREARRELHEEIVGEILSRPQQIMVTDREFDTLKSKGQAVLSGIDLHGRRLLQGEKVILLNENMKEVEAEFVGRGDDIFTKKIKVRLPKN